MERRRRKEEFYMEHHLRNCQDRLVDRIVGLILKQGGEVRQSLSRGGDEHTLGLHVLAPE